MVDNYTSLTSIKAYAPNLTIVMLGINDAQSSEAVSTYSTNIQTLITTAKLSGDVIIMSPVPSDPSLTTTVAFEAAYTSTLQGFAASNNIVFMDLFHRFGGAFVSPMMTKYTPSQSGRLLRCSTFRVFVLVLIQSHLWPASPRAFLQFRKRVQVMSSYRTTIAGTVVALLTYITNDPGPFCFLSAISCYHPATISASKRAYNDLCGLEIT